MSRKGRSPIAQRFIVGNSFQQIMESRKGRKIFRPYRTPFIKRPTPTINRWAINKCSYGTKNFSVGAITLTMFLSLRERRKVLRWRNFKEKKRKAIKTFRFAFCLFTFAFTNLRRGIFCIFCLNRSCTGRSA